MLMAARKLQGIGLVLLVLIFAMMLYPVSLKVAATRSELARIAAICAVVIEDRCAAESC